MGRGCPKNADMTRIFHAALAVALVLPLGCDKKEPAAAAASASSAPAPAAATSASPPAEAEKELLGIGDDAPAIDAVAHNGQKVTLAQFKGKPVVVYFYPKDDTPGCTVEAKGIRDEWPELRKAGAVVLGVSSDDNVSHRAFASKYDLPFLLVPDTDHKIAGAFGVPVNNGHAKRVTFLIDKGGKIAKVFPDVTPDGHAKELVAAIGGLQG